MRHLEVSSRPPVDAPIDRGGNVSFSHIDTSSSQIVPLADQRPGSRISDSKVSRFAPTPNLGDRTRIPGSEVTTPPVNPPSPIARGNTGHEVSGTTISSEGGRSTVPHPTPTPAETSAPSRDVGAGTSAPVTGTTESRPIHTDAVASEIQQGAHEKALALRGDTADVELRAPTVDIDDLKNREGNALTEEIVAKTQDRDLFVKGKTWTPI